MPSESISLSLLVRLLSPLFSSSSLCPLASLSSSVLSSLPSLLSLSLVWAATLFCLGLDGPDLFLPVPRSSAIFSRRIQILEIVAGGILKCSEASLTVGGRHAPSHERPDIVRLFPSRHCSTSGSWIRWRIKYSIITILRAILTSLKARSLGLMGFKDARLARSSSVMGLGPRFFFTLTGGCGTTS